MSFEDKYGGKLLPALFSAVLSGAVVWPILQNWRETPKDSFPFSYYPMFSAKRGKLTRVTYLAGLDAAGAGHPLPYTLAGTGGLNQVRRQVNRAVREGREAELSETVARNVARSREESLADVEVVRIIKGSYRLSDYFAGHRRAFSERVVAEAKVPRDSEGAA